MKDPIFRPAMDWQSRAVVSRHLRVHLRNWHTAAIPPICEPLIMLLAFGVGLGQQISALTWQGQPIDYLAYLAPGILAYTAFMTSFFQSLWSAYMRMHFQRSWEGQLTTQVRLPHVIWGELLWSATLATTYSLIVCVVLLGFDVAGFVALHWAWLPVAIPILFLAALGFSCVGLFFTATVPSIDHMGLPFFLVILPIGFASSTYFPLPPIPWLENVVQFNPLHHLSEGLRWLMLRGEPTWHLAAAAALSLFIVFALLPLDMRLLRKRVFGDA
jgi:lipooligosaccharide transport system permease protein